jgi:hypothetical protein
MWRKKGEHCGQPASRMLLLAKRKHKGERAREEDVF